MGGGGGCSSGSVLTGSPAMAPPSGWMLAARGPLSAEHRVPRRSTSRGIKSQERRTLRSDALLQRHAAAPEGLQTYVHGHPGRWR